ncbi:NAD(P)-dependent alcohol dehydrogenase [Roseomonas sp. HJA6]|uniref:NAD(P)-dependent alcohol dehydrogenase n=1 Tax=Roseomonas alba TaxID=2846776 RepID=A0ABS7AAF4_9PROT|nr:NAD(P)-dependent alcohol dehydrogenase [Neoroseomonas alba]MBW6399286.1 NAD(P)-dependent alcohol dehydrogenase [Neoroseomonas alba]
MRAYRFETLGGLDGLRPCTMDVPRPQRGEVLVRVKTVALNYRDISILGPRYPHPVLAGLVPASDAMGEIVEVGESVRAFRPGDRVIGCFHPRWFGGRMPSTAGTDSYGSQQDGWLMELKAVSQETVVRIPDSLTDEEAATLPCAGLTAWSALGGASPIRAGSQVLTLGSGGVSVFALQLAKAVGARVISTTSSAAKAERLRALGADVVIDYTTTPEWGDVVRDLSGSRGVDRVVEVGGPGTLAQSLRACAIGGEIALVGFLTEQDPGFGYFQIKQSGAMLRPITVGDRPGLEELIRVVATTGLRPVIDRVFAFEEAAAAFAHLEAARHVGKVVIRVATA